MKRLLYFCIQFSDCIFILVLYCVYLYVYMFYNIEYLGMGILALADLESGCGGCNLIWCDIGIKMSFYANFGL